MEGNRTALSNHLGNRVFLDVTLFELEFLADAVQALREEGNEGYPESVFDAMEDLISKAITEAQGPHKKVTPE